MAKADSRTKLLDHATAAVRKAYGGDKSARASEDLVYPSVWASTGSIVLDRIIAGKIPGGVPMGPRRGRVVHVFGKWSLGKSVLVDMVAASVQAPPINGLVLITETEGSRDPHFADAIGLQLSLAEIQRPDTIEELFDLGIDWVLDVRKQDRAIPILWAVDSLETIEAGQTWQVKMSGKGGGAYEFGGGRAGKIGAGLRKLANLCSKHPTSVLLLNQIRDRPGVMFGKKTGSTGGNAPKFLASVELELRHSRYGIIGQGGRAIGQWVYVEAVKNKISPPFAKGDFVIHFQKGVLKWHGVLEMLEAEGRLKVPRKGEKGPIVGSEFTDTKTGEIVPLADFVAWCDRSGALQGGAEWQQKSTTTN